MRVLSVVVLTVLGGVAVAMLVYGEWGFAVISVLLCALVGAQLLRRGRGGREAPPEPGAGPSAPGPPR